MPVEAPPSHLLEREDDLARIEGALARARDGRGTLILVEGPAGVGKTALLAEARAIAQSAGMQILRSRGAELEREFAFGVVRQLFEPALRGLGDAEGLFQGPAGVAASLLELPGAPARDGEAFADQDSSFAVLHGLYWLCADLAERRPLCVVVDDAQWADAPSLRFLSFLVPRLEELAVALLIAARPREASEQAALLESLAADVTAEVVTPAPLTPAGVAELLSLGLGAVPEPAFADDCHRATGGLPFLVRHVVARLRENGMAPTQGAAPFVGALGGRTVGRWLLVRLGQLPPAAGRLARALAVLETADVGQARALAELDVGEAAIATDTLAAAGVLAPGRPLAFAHPMVREGLYGELSPAERARAHREAARLLHDAGGAPERVAEHLLATEPAADGWVVDRLVDAARRAAASGAPESAAVYLRRALAEPPPRDRSRLLLECGLAEANAGEPGWYPHLQAAIAAAADGRSRAAVALTTAQALLRDQRPEEALRVVDSAAEELGDGDQRVRALLEAMAVVAGSLDARLSPTIVTRSAALRQLAASDPAAPRDILAVAAWTAAFANEPAAVGVEFARRALRASPRPTPDPGDLPSTWFSLATIVLIWAERYAEAAELLETAVVECRAAGAGGNLATALTYRAWLALRRGDLRAAEVDARTGVEAADLPLPLLYRLIATSILVGSLVERGEPEAAARALASVAAWVEEPSMGSATLRLARARLRMAQGLTNDALADFLAVGDVAARSSACSPSILPWRAEAAVAHLLRGDQEAALELAEDDLALARDFGTPRTLGVALRAAGLATGDRRGEDMLREAVAVLAGSDARVEHIRAQTDLGAHLRRANRRGEAREHLRAALDAAHQAGAGALAARAEAELRATGARPRRLVLSGLDSLTASERRVAELARDGMTNREIAQSLFVTARTVEGHLTHVFRKLDLSAREELTEALAPVGA